MLTIDTDYHVHSEFSFCATDITLERIFQLGDGLYLAVTDHSAHQYFRPGRGWSLAREDVVDLVEEQRDYGRENLERYIAMIRALGRPEILVGLEVDILPTGDLVFEEDLREEFDVLIGSVHHLPSYVQGRSPAEIVAEWQTRVCQFCDQGMDILGHPFRIFAQYGLPVSDGLIAWTVERCTAAGVALEINSHQPSPQDDVRLIRCAREQGARLAIATDAHATWEFGEFSYHRQVLAAAGVESQEEWERLNWRAVPHLDFGASAP